MAMRKETAGGISPPGHMPYTVFWCGPGIDQAAPPARLSVVIQRKAAERAERTSNPGTRDGVAAHHGSQALTGVN